MRKIDCCKYISFVDCKEKNGCAWCGWNPETAQRRVEQLRNARTQKRSPRAAVANAEAHEDNMMIPQTAADCKG